jgi:8-oxo-dGTP diphosphatase
VEEGELKLLEHEAAKWLKKDELDSVDWLPADLGILPKLAAAMV